MNFKGQTGMDHLLFYKQAQEWINSVILFAQN